MKLKELLESRPEKNAHLTEVAIQRSAATLTQNLLVFLIDRQHQQDCI